MALWGCCAEVRAREGGRKVKEEEGGALQFERGGNKHKDEREQLVGLVDPCPPQGHQPPDDTCTHGPCLMGHPKKSHMGERGAHTPATAISGLVQATASTP